jgi:transglutaminase-like putative cysteine protease
MKIKSILNASQFPQTTRVLRPTLRWTVPFFHFMARALVLLMIAASPLLNAVAGGMDEATRLEESGNFAEAAKVLKTALTSKNNTPDEQKALAFELDRLQRIKNDFPFTREGLFDELRNSVKGLTQDEFDQWVKEKRFDSRMIDGKQLFMASSVPNLFFRYAELNPRRLPLKNGAAHDQAQLEACREIRQAAIASKTPYVLPRRFHVTMTVTANAKAAPAGEVIRAWLPIPRDYPFQKDFLLTGTSDPMKHLDSPASTARSIYLEHTASGNKPTEFKITYDYTKYGVRFEVNPADVKPAPETPGLKPFISEGPHVVFTPEIRALSKEIAGDETNPYLKAKRFYDWIGAQIKYSYAIEYSTIPNISEYCRTHGYGDCGQEALLFITLCRLNGIPARWQSGWDTFPHSTTIHDWSEIYIAPYGWMPVDPYMSIYATRYATTLSDAQKKEIRDFFFGGQDWYRMAANSDHNQVLNPPKRSMRSDNVDFQRGELEWGDHNIYFDKYSYKLTYTEEKLTPE